MRQFPVEISLASVLNDIVLGVEYVENDPLWLLLGLFGLLRVRFGALLGLLDD